MLHYLQNPKAKIVFILIFAFAIRLIGIASRPIWYDEAFSILFSEKGLNAMIYGTLSQTGAGSADIHPLGYYTLLWAWMKIFGQTIPIVRLFSIVANLASIFLIYHIALILFNDKTAITTALLFSILPFQVHFAQEIRMYSLLSFWLLLTTFSFLRGRNGNWKWWILFALSSALAQYTHNLAAIYLIPLAITPLIQKDWKTFKAVVVASMFSILLYLPWLIYLPSQFSKVNSSYWVERPGVEKLFTLLLFYLPHLPLPNKLLLPGLMISTIIVTLAVFQTILARKNKLTDLNRGIWLAYLAFMPPLLLWLISQFVPVYIERALLPSHAIFCIWLSWAFTQTKMPNPVQIAVFGLIIVAAIIGFFQHVTYSGFPYGPFSALNKRIDAEFQQGDVVIHSNKLSYLPALYFGPEAPQGYITDPSGSTTDTLAPATQEILQIQAYDSIQTATMDKNRVLFIIYQQSIDEYVVSGDVHPDLKYLNINFILTSTKIFDDIRLYLYIKKLP
ncbi:MAG: glycosyltransferase family 39 protein [Anaerolineales bacterium]|nr:glycosyltransferase family 39 protein [Anaerolineales bacterium]